MRSDFSLNTLEGKEWRSERYYILCPDGLQERDVEAPQLLWEQFL